MKKDNITRIIILKNLIIKFKSLRIVDIDIFIYQKEDEVGEVNKKMQEPNDYRNFPFTFKIYNTLIT